MKIFIVRHGSGWGGKMGKIMIDTSKKKWINLDKYQSKYRSSLYKYDKDDINSLSAKIEDYPEDCIGDFSWDVSLLESFLEDCELHRENFNAMDAQEDEVFILTTKSEVRKVYTTIGEICYPENPALFAKLQKLVEIMI